MKIAKIVMSTMLAFSLVACSSSGGNQVNNSGTTSTNGTNSSTGTNGTSGTTGTNGTNSSTGTNGTSGSTGTNGTSGTTGTNGTSGSTGTNGTNTTNRNNGITTAIATDKTLYSLTHSWKVSPPTGTLASEVKKAVADTNKLRAEVGLPALKEDPNLSAYAQRRAEEIVRSFEHARLNGQDIWKGATGNAWKGENIAAGNSTSAKTVLVQWRNSKGHYSNIISGNFTKIGVGVVYVPNSEFGYYWVQIFGSDEASSKYYFDANIAETDNKNPLTTLLVDGKTIPLKNPNGQWQTLNSNGYKGTYNGYAYSRFGVLTNENSKTGLYQTFYQGTPTTNMPTTGTAKYVGKAVWADANSVNNNLTAKFDVNFANKNVSGSITDAAKTTIKLNANITGNTFHSPIGADVETHGGFFGNNAAEISGDFREQKVGGKTGAFGAVKQ